MKLDLPPVTPLPPDVRRRALDTVLDGLDEPAPRRFRPELVAAAVVVALLVGLTAAVSWAGRPDPLLAAAGAAAAEVDIRSTEGMISRCAAAVEGMDGYPPVDGWAASLAFAGSYTDPVIVVDDAFACRLTPVGVYVSGTEGTPMGDVGVVELGPGMVVLLNPHRRAIGMDDPSWNISRPDDAVQLLIPPDTDRPDTRFTIKDRFAGPLPDPAPPAVTVQDRTLPTRASYGSTGATAEDGDLASCAGSTFPTGPSTDLWTPVRRIDGGPVPLLLARIGDQYVGLCGLTPDGPTFAVAPMPARDGTTVEPGDHVVPPPMLQFTPGAYGLYGFDQAPEFPAGEPCTVTDGISFCGDPTGPLDVRLITPSEDLTVPRAPGR